MIPWLSGASGRKALINPGSLSNSIIFSRAQAGGALSTDTSPAKLLSYYSANVPRFGGSSNWLLLEGQRTNSITYASDLSNGVWASNLGAVATSGPAGIAPDGGNSAWRVDLTTNQFSSMRNSIGGTQNDSAALSIFARMVSGTGSIRYHSAGSAVAQGPDKAISAVWSRLTDQYDTGFATGVGYGSIGDGVARSIYQFGLMVERGAAFASSYIPTTTAALTRGRDVATIPLSARGIPTTGAGTYFGTALIPQNAPTGVSQTIIRIDKNVDDNDALGIINSAAGATITGFRVTAGVFSAPPLGTMTAGTAFPWCIIVYGNGNADFKIGNNAWQSVAGAVNSGLTTARIGGAIAPGSELYGRVGTFDMTPIVMSQTAAANLVASLPLV